MSLHYLERDEVNGLKLLQRQQQAKWRKRAYVFINERPPALRPDGPAASPSSLVRSGERMVSDRPRRGHAACPRGRNVGTVNTWHGADEGKAVFGDRPEARLPRFDRRRGERGLSNNRLCCGIEWPAIIGKGVAHRDNNMRAAIIHVLADAAVSVLVIVGLLFGRFLGWTWMDPVVGLCGAVVIAAWSYGLVRDTGAVLLDMNPDRGMAKRMRAAIETDGDQLTDLHLSRLGPGIWVPSSRSQHSGSAGRSIISHCSAGLAPCPT